MWSFIFYRKGWRQPLDELAKIEVWDGLDERAILPASLFVGFLAGLLTLVQGFRQVLDGPGGTDASEANPRGPILPSPPRLIGTNGRRLRGRP